MIKSASVFKLSCLTEILSVSSLVSFLVPFLVLASVGCSSAPTVSEEPRAVENPERVECTQGDDVRLLEVEHVSLGCTLNYSKQGKIEKVVASGSGPQACLSQLQNIKKALGAAGYACR